MVEVLSKNLIGAAKKYGVDKIAIAGGVAANSALRAELEKRKGNLKLYYPSPIFCTDNAAMVGCCGYYEFLNGNFKDLTLNAIPYLNVEQN